MVVWMMLCGDVVCDVVCCSCVLFLCGYVVYYVICGGMVLCVVLFGDVVSNVMWAVLRYCFLAKNKFF